MNQSKVYAGIAAVILVGLLFFCCSRGVRKMNDNTTMADNDPVTMENMKIQEYVAVIGHQAPVGGGTTKVDTIKMSVKIVGYVKDGGPLVAEERMLFKEMSGAELKEIWKRVKPHAVIRFAGVEEPYSSVYTAGIRMQQLLETDVADARFSAIQADLKKVVTYTSERLGMLTLNKQYDWYEGTLAWGERSVEIRLVVSEPRAMQPEPKIEAIAVALFQDYQTWDAKVRAYAASELLPIKNESWIEDESERETAESFGKKMILRSIEVELDGSFIFEFDDGGIFSDHFITVGGNLTDGFLHAEF